MLLRLQLLMLPATQPTLGVCPCVSFRVNASVCAPQFVTDWGSSSSGEESPDSIDAPPDYYPAAQQEREHKLQSVV
jgi:hypothetical protein